MSYDLMFQKAIELQNNGALNEAENIYLKLLEVMPQNSDVWNLLGLIAQAKGNLEQAVNCFLSAITYAPTPFAPHFFNLGLTYRGLHKYREALEALQTAVKLQPAFKEAWNFLGLTQEELDEHQEAIKSFCRALDIDNDYNEARANLCFYTKDKETLFKLADEQPDDLQANLLAAACCEALDDKEKYLRQAVLHHPFHTSALLNLAKVCAEKENFSESLQLYHKVLNLDENSVEAILGIADVSLQINDLDKAELYYKKSFNLARDIAGAHLNYGILLYRQKRLAEALEQYRAAVQLEPEKPEISYNLALILKEVGEYEEALGLMFNAHQRCPEKKEFSVNIMETLSELYAQNAELALKIAENWQKIEPDNIFSKRIFAAISGVSASALSHSYTCTVIPDEKIDGLMPGMVCKVSAGTAGSGIVIPASSVKTGMDGRYVWIVRDGKAARRSIETGGFSGDGVIVESGLASGDLLIVEGAKKVSSGMTVKVVE